MGSSIPAVKAALVSLLTTAYAATEPDVLVSYGHPGETPQDDIVAVMAAESDQSLGPMRPAPHSREETVRATVTLSCWRGGGPEVQQTVTERAYALLAVLETALRADVTLSGTVRMAQVIGTVLVEATDPDVLAQGRVSEVEVTIQTQTRI